MKYRHNRFSAYFYGYAVEMHNSFYAHFLVLDFLAVTSAQAMEQSITLSGLNVTVWSQENAKIIKQPVIIFSHGFHGWARQSRFLMKAFASAGYIVFAPNHRDAICNNGQVNLFGKAQTPFRHPAAWSENTFRDRAGDIRQLIDALHVDETFQARLDWSRLGLTGHSLGGYTVLGLAGAWSSWELNGIKAVLALSPYSHPFIIHKTLRGLSAPVMYQGGTLDFGITSSLHKSSGSYDLSPKPKYLVEFLRAFHFAWADLGIVAHDAISYYSLAFMDHYVKGEPDEKRLTKVLSGIALYRYSSEFGDSKEPAGQK